MVDRPVAGSVLVDNIERAFVLPAAAKSDAIELSVRAGRQLAHRDGAAAISIAETLDQLEPRRRYPQPAHQPYAPTNHQRHPRNMPAKQGMEYIHE